mmetsp:Transcript_26506/g.62082  ORF Transcript_26506/g.62082 Transcript_26506/m.62082 type:complete len:444 (-) Transcript_26506:416-1747(-)
MDIETDMDNEMSYVDRVVQAHGGDEDSDGDEDWVEGDSGREQDADGDGDESVAGETDDVLEYDFDLRDGASSQYFDWEEIPERVILATTDYARARPVQKQLSETAKEHLTWRLEKKGSFSDWTIVVSSDDGSIDFIEYNVHRLILATGPRKSGYFESMLLSPGEFQEQGNATSPIELPADIVSGFPTFLDYLYAPISEAKYVITPENVMQLRYLADYFLVPTLSDSVHEFIKQDMNCLERTEEYLRMAVQEGLDTLIAHAAHVCIRHFCEIKQDSSLLYSMPPAFFWHFIAYASQLGQEQFKAINIDLSRFANFLHLLVVSYMRNHGGRLGLPYFLAVFDQIAGVMPNPCEEGFAIVMDYLDIFKIHGWTLAFSRGWMDPNKKFVTCCTETLYRYTTRDFATDLEVVTIMAQVPHCIAAELVVKTSKKLRGEGNDNGSLVEVE